MEEARLLEAVTPSKLEEYYTHLKQTNLTASAISEKMCQLAAGATVLLNIIADNTDDENDDNSDEASTTEV